MLRKTIAVLMLAFSASMVVAAQAGASEQPRKFCAAALGKADAAGVRPVGEQVCSTVSQEDAQGKLHSRQTNSVLADVPLMIWYEHSYYGGESTVIYGDSGYCDSSGYGVRPSAWWTSHISSIKGINTCNRVTLASSGVPGGYFALDAPGLGSFNDNVGHMRVYAG